MLHHTTNKNTASQYSPVILHRSLSAIELLRGPGSPFVLGRVGAGNLWAVLCGDTHWFTEVRVEVTHPAK